jgi:Tol biopolymer transport system component
MRIAVILSKSRGKPAITWHQDTSAEMNPGPPRKDLRRKRANYCRKPVKDGRLFIHRIQSAEREVYLLTPNPGGLGKYERVTMPSNRYFHKACISPDETKITYMDDYDNNGATYADARIAWARFDTKGLRVYDPTLITPDSPTTIEEYPKWSPDGSMVLYDSNKANGGGDIYQIYAYRITDGVERLLSHDPKQNDQFVCVLGLPK